MINAANLKERIPILSVVRRFVDLAQRKNGDWWGCCPFHEERTPSFHVKEAEGYWKCFGCGKGGNIFGFVMQTHKVDYADAVKLLSEEFHIIEYDRYANASMANASSPPAPQLSVSKGYTNWKQLLSGIQPLKGSQAEEYLHSRGIDMQVFHEMSLGVRYHPDWYSKGPAVIFKIADQYQQTVAAEGRYLDAKVKPKVKSAGLKGNGIFTTPGAFDGQMIIVESPINALSLAMCDAPAVATCGAANHPSCLLEACKGKRVWIAFDPDTGGDTGAISLATDLSRAGIASKWLKPPVDGMDWNDVLIAYGRDELARALAKVLLGGSDV